jgi:hypothetical protein
MSVEIQIIDNTPGADKRAQLLLESDNNFTSAITVQAGKRVNIGIVVGTQISDILSTATFSTTISQLTSVFSGTVTLQRRMSDETESYHWRDVSSWTISSGGGGIGGSENITANPEPETVEYRAGIKTTNYTGGVGHLRIGTN